MFAAVKSQIKFWSIDGDSTWEITRELFSNTPGVILSGQVREIPLKMSGEN